MSDKKYIIAGSDDDGEHTRLGCLAMVRYAVAAVVTVLTITVIALSIHAVLRSEDMGLSVNKGYIGADILWTYPSSPPPPPAATSKSPVPSAEPATPAAKLSRRRGLLSLLPETSDDSDDVLESTNESDVYSGATAQVYVGSSSSRSLPKDCFLGCSGGGGDEPTQVTLKKADRTSLRVILIANNPGGRTKIDCNGTRVRLLDVEYPYGQIGNVTLKNFTVPPQTTIKLQQRLNNTNTSYIWENYHLASRFSVRVEVTSIVTSYPLGKKGKTIQQTYVCQPVTIGLLKYEAIYASDDHVHCTKASISSG